MVVLLQILWRVPAVKSGVGRKATLTEEDKVRLVNMIKGMVKKADTRHTITAHMLQSRVTPRVSLRVLAGAQQFMLRCDYRCYPGSRSCAFADIDAGLVYDYYMIII